MDQQTNTLKSFVKTSRWLLFIILCVTLVFDFEYAHSDDRGATEDSTAAVVSLDDGPHVFWQDDSVATVIYFVDGDFQRWNVAGAPLPTFAGFAWDDTIRYALHGHFDTQTEEDIDGVSRILAVSDIHGEYEYFVDILQRMKIIDSARHWIWGDGHLVIVGDVFDRGARVTECLWLIYHLEVGARAAGGAVHFLIGNHELMPLRDDFRYVNERYLEGISRRNRINYADLFGSQTELGRWVRSKNTVMTINDIMFVHGGVSPALIDSAFSVREINRRMRTLIDQPAQELLFDERSLFLTKSLGPLWYRGYHYGMDGRYERASSADIDRILAHFGAKAIVVGHTGIDSVASLYDDRVFAIDIHYEDIEALEGLLWDKSGFYRVTGDGHLRLLAEN